MSGRDRQDRRDTVVLLFLAAAGTALGTAGRRGPAAVQGVALGVEVVVVLLLAGLAVRWVVRRRRAQRSSSDGRVPLAPAYGSVQRAAQQRPWTLMAAPFYGLYLGWFAAPLAWWLPPTLFVGALALGLVVGALLRASRRRRWSAARAAHPGAAVALVAADAFVGMRLTQWAKAVGATVPSPGVGDAVLAADDDGVSLWRPDRPEPVHRWAWEDVELSRASSSTDVPHLVLTLLGPPPAVRARAVPATRRRFDLALAVRTAAGSPEAVDAATAAALDDLLAARGAPARVAEGSDRDPGTSGPAGAATGGDGPAASPGVGAR